MLKIKYPNTQIFFDDSFQNLSSYIKILDKENVFYFIDKKVFEIYNDVFNSLKNIIIIDSNEKSKSIEYSTSLINKLIHLEANKKSYFIAIGGGVVCDITGFISSIYMRGVRFAYVPTTVLSITDASLGGKNGVNFNGIKNLVGTINEPDFILIDLSFLTSLEKSEVENGFAEIIKHACIASPELFLFLSKVKINFKSKDFYYQILQESISIKLDIVKQDLNDLNQRKVLNFGHTYGHAIESQYNMPHGCSVSLGIVFACNISKQLGYLSIEKVKEVKALLNRFNLPIDISRIKIDDIMPFILKDKKAKNEKIDFVILEDIGKAKIIEIEIEKIKYE